MSMKQKITVGEWLEMWLKMRSIRLRPRTIEQYERLIRIHAAPIAGKKLKKVDAEDIQDLLAEICEAGKGRTAEQLYVLLSTAFKQAVLLKKIKDNPMLGVIRPAHKAKIHAVWSPEEQRAVFKALKGDKYQLEILLGLLCGLRRGEICGLKWSDVDLAEGLIHVERQIQRLDNGKLIEVPPKSDAGRRVIPIPQALRAPLAARAAIGGYVTALTPEGLGRALRRAEIRAGVTHIGLHGLRHTMATNAVRGGVNLRLVQNLLGHTSYNLTARVYTHPDLQMLKYAVDAAYVSVV